MKAVQTCDNNVNERCPCDNNVSEFKLDAHVTIMLIKDVDFLSNNDLCSPATHPTKYQIYLFQI